MQRISSDPFHGESLCVSLTFLLQQLPISALDLERDSKNLIDFSCYTLFIFWLFYNSF